MLLKLATKSLAFILVLSLVGCAAGERVSDQGTYRERIGTSTYQDVTRQAERVLVSEHSYRLDREVLRREDVRFITMWAEHTPLEDERAQGLTSVRTRIIVQARPKNRTAGTYTVNFRAECEGRSQNGPWESMKISEMREEYIEEIVNDLEDELTSGVRSR